MKPNRVDNADNYIDTLIIGIVIIIILGKIFGIITISWIWLLFPIWGSIALGILITISVSAYLLIDYLREKRRIKNERN